MVKRLPGRGEIEISTDSESGLIYIQQRDIPGNTDTVSVAPHDVPVIVALLQEAAAELTAGGPRTKDQQKPVIQPSASMQTLR